MKKLNLGKELGKNEQKKVIGGGAAIYCAGIYDVYLYSSQQLSCSMSAAYCTGHMQTLVACYNW